jgi:hypothetical protein
MARVKPYLSVCAMFLDEAAYLREWIEFHRLVGVERFFLYDHESTDSSREVLAPYVEEGTVVVHDWPVYPGQIEAFSNCLERHRDDSRWIAFIDLDEFLFSPLAKPLPEVLVDYEQYPAVVASWVMFGTSNHLTKPPGLVIENYLRRKEYPEGAWEHIKSIIDPTRTESCPSGHAFLYRDGAHAVDEKHLPVTERPLSRFQPVTFERLRVNHYCRRSWEEYQRKLSRPRADTATFREDDERTRERRERKLNAVYDDTITMYLPALRERIEAADQRAAARPVETPR